MVQKYNKVVSVALIGSSGKVMDEQKVTVLLTGEQIRAMPYGTVHMPPMRGGTTSLRGKLTEDEAMGYLKEKYPKLF